MSSARVASEAGFLIGEVVCRAWLHRYVFPWRESGSDSPFYYSYNYGKKNQRLCIHQASDYVSTSILSLMLSKLLQVLKTSQ